MMTNMKLVILFTFPVVSLTLNTLEVEPLNTFHEPGYSKLSWFVHLTDIHVSSWQDPPRQSQVGWCLVDIPQQIQIGAYSSWKTLW